MVKKSKITAVISIVLTLMFFAAQVLPFTAAKAAETDTVNVNVRIEGDGKTILPETNVDVSNYDLTKYNCDNVSGIKAIHAVVAALLKGGFDPSDSSKFDFSKGSYATKIDGVTTPSTGGWGYCINDVSPTDSLSQYTLKNGDNIVIYYMKNYNNFNYSYFDKNNVSAKINDNITLNLKGVFFNPDWSTSNKAVDNAEVFVNDVSAGKKTDADGNVSLSFDKEGTYTVTAIKKDVNGDEIISMPYCKITVSDSSLPDTTKPVITTDLQNKTVSEKNYKFTVNVSDDRDGNIVPEVKFGGTVLTPSADGSYNISLNDGSNNIHIEACDKASNKAEQDYTIVYKELVPASDVSIEMNKTLDYLKSNNSDEWSAICLSKFGVKGNQEFFNETMQNLKDRLEQNGLSKSFRYNTDIEKMIMYLSSQGYSPYNVFGCDLVNELYNRDINNFYMYDQIYGLLVYNYANISGSYKVSRDTLVNKLLSEKVTSSDKNGNKLVGWNIMGDNSIDPDTTGLAISALSKYYGTNADVKKAVDDAVNTLSVLQQDNGCYKSLYDTSEPSESISCVILGLTSVGVDPEGSMFTKNGTDGVKNNLVTALMRYRGDNGQFRHTIDGENDATATTEALEALIALNGFDKSGKYDYYSNSDTSKQNTVTINNSNNVSDGNSSVNTMLPKTGYFVDMRVLLSIGIALVIAGAVIFIANKKRKVSIIKK